MLCPELRASFVVVVVGGGGGGGGGAVCWLAFGTSVGELSVCGPFRADCTVDGALKSKN